MAENNPDSKKVPETHLEIIRNKNENIDLKYLICVCSENKYVSQSKMSGRVS